jgi:hypothetical protein
MNRSVLRAAVRCGVAAFAFSLLMGGVAQAQTTKRIAVLMFKPQNYGTQWITESAVRSVLWTGAKSANSYYQEASFGKWKLQGRLRVDGDVFGWYTLPYNDTGNCLGFTWATTAKTMAAAQGFVDTNYDVVVYVTKATGCPGRAWTSGRTITVLSGFDSETLAHELGHAFGLAHASNWACTNNSGVKVSISTTCGVNEYGDYAVMGKTTDRHLNNFQKGALGFFDASNTKTVTTTGVYSLYPTETKTSLVQVLRIPRKYDASGKVLDFYYLEFRQQYGFDDFSDSSPYINGVSIRVAPEYTTYKAHSYLIDATTPALTTFSDAPLKVGATFTDTTRKVSVTLLSINGGVAQVRVDFF